MKKLIFVLIVLGLEAPSPCYGQAQSPSQENGQGKQGETNSANPISANPVSDGHEQKGDTQQRSTGDDSSSNWCLVGLTLALVGVGIAQVAVYRKQAKLMREAIDQSRKSSESELRAYVTLSGMKFHHTPAPKEGVDDFFGSTLLFRNGGQTPASKIITHVFWEFFSGEDAHLSDNYQFPGMETVDPKIMERTGSSSMIGVGEARTSEHGFMPKPNGITFKDAYSKFLRRDVTIFLFARIEYTDVFGECRMTRGCARLELQDNSAPSILTYDMFNDFT